MSLIPAFEIGLWNAWIFMLYHFLPMPLLMLIHKGATEKGQPEPHSETEKNLYPNLSITHLTVDTRYDPSGDWYIVGMEKRASRLVRNAGGILVHAHPNDSNGTSLVSITPDLDEQANIIEEYMLDYIEFAKKYGLLMTGGSDCHQKPLLMGTLDIPDYVAEQFR